MPNKKYAQGRYVEYRTVKYFKDKGYQAWRTAGSHGPFDVIAINAKEVVLAQVKSYQGNKPKYDVGVEKLHKLIVPEWVDKVFVTYQMGSGKLEVTNV